MENSKRKIGPIGFDLAANTHLYGTNFCDLLTSIRLETDDDGNIKETVIENIKKSLKVAFEMCEDVIVKRKIENMKTFMEDY